MSRPCQSKAIFGAETISCRLANGHKGQCQYGRYTDDGEFIPNPLLGLM